MSKTLLKEAHANEIVVRANKLMPASKCLWGSMTLNLMLNHCTLTNTMILNGKPGSKTPTIRQRMLKIGVLYIMSGLPKGIQSNSKYIQQEQQDFEIERTGFINSVKRFIHYEGILNGSHPVFGRLNTREWGRFVYMHMDHHLRQFGV